MQSKDFGPNKNLTVRWTTVIFDSVNVIIKFPNTCRLFLLVRMEVMEGD